MCEQIPSQSGHLLSTPLVKSDVLWSSNNQKNYRKIVQYTQYSFQHSIWNRGRLVCSWWMESLSLTKSYWPKLTKRMLTSIFPIWAHRLADLDYQMQPWLYWHHLRFSCNNFKSSTFSCHGDLRNRCTILTFKSELLGGFQINVNAGNERKRGIES